MVLKADGWKVIERNVLRGQPSTVRDVEFFAFVPVQQGRDAMAIQVVPLALVDGELRAILGKLQKV